MKLTRATAISLMTTSTQLSDNTMVRMDLKASHPFGFLAGLPAHTCSIVKHQKMSITIASTLISKS